MANAVDEKKCENENPKNVDEMEFEEALGELESIVKTLEDGKSTLKESVELYERGVILKKRCDKILEAAQLKINQIAVDNNSGNVTLTEVTL